MILYIEDVSMLCKEKKMNNKKYTDNRKKMDTVDTKPELAKGDSWITPEEAVEILGGHIREEYLLKIMKQKDFPIYNGMVKRSTVSYMKGVMEKGAPDQ